MKKEKYWKVTKVVCLVVTSIAVLYDIVIAALSGGEATLSKVTLWTSIRWTGLPFVWGLLTSHFFLGRPGRFLFGKIPRLRFAIWIPIAVAYIILTVIGGIKGAPIVVWLGSNLYIPLLYGMTLGLMWWQKRPSK